MKYNKIVTYSTLLIRLSLKIYEFQQVLEKSITLLYSG